MVNIGIIGTGSMANAHADNLAKIKGVRLSACCDISGERVAAFADKWRIKKSYCDYEEMLDNKDLDGICIVTSDAGHAPISIAALKKGVGVLCEKPLASTVAEARAMTAAAKKSNAVNMVNLSKRNAAGLQEIVRRLNNGDIGELRHFEARYLQGWAGTMDWTKTPENSGGVWRISSANGNAGTLSDLGVHVYDAARFLCGDFKNVFCRFTRYDKGISRIGRFKLDAPDTFFAIIEFKNKIVGEIHSTRWAAGSGDGVQIIVSGTKGSFTFDLERNNGNAYRWYSHKRKAWQDILCKPQPSTWDRFVRALKTGKNGEPDFSDGLAVQNYLESSVLSDKLGKPVAISV